MDSRTAQARPRWRVQVRERRRPGLFFLWILATLLCWPGLSAGKANAAGKEACSAPAELVRFGRALPHLAQVLRHGEPARIVALGSSSTEGAGASSRQARYPARLEAELRRRFPGRTIEVVNLGIGGELASDMVRRIGTDVIGLKPQLVIWQTGVNDALRAVGIETFRDLVTGGVKRLRDSGSDVVLLDQQYFPRSAELPAYAQFVAAMHQISQAQQVPVLRRYDIMRHLVSSARYAPDDLLAPDRFHQNDEGYRCLGLLMADAIEMSVTSRPDAPRLLNAAAGSVPGAGG